MQPLAPACYHPVFFLEAPSELYQIAHGVLDGQHPGKMIKEIRLQK